MRWYVAGMLMVFPWMMCTFRGKIGFSRDLCAKWFLPKEKEVNDKDH
jgi:hypothetical protein